MSSGTHWYFMQWWSSMSPSRQAAYKRLFNVRHHQYLTPLSLSVSIYPIRSWRTDCLRSIWHTLCISHTPVILSINNFPTNVHFTQSLQQVTKVVTKHGVPREDRLPRSGRNMLLYEQTTIFRQKKHNGARQTKMDHLKFIHRENEKRIAEIERHVDLLVTVFLSGNLWTVSSARQGDVVKIIHVSMFAGTLSNIKRQWTK